MANAEVMTKWVEALESGDYEQTKGKLHRVEPDDFEGEEVPAGYCCLGVLCDLAVKEGVIPPPIFNKAVGYALYMGDPDSLPPLVQMWAGIERGNPYVDYEYPDGDSGEDTLANLNDEQDMSFPEIAKIVRENFLAES